MFIKSFFIKRLKKNLVVGISSRAGRNCFGRKTIVTQSGGLRLYLHSIDFKRNINEFFCLLKIEKNINFTSFLGLICYSNGFFCYILLSNFMNVLNKMYLGFNFFYSLSSMFLKFIPAGNFIHHIENKPFSGAKLMRAAGTSCFIISQEHNYSHLKMPSGWLLKVHKFCIAVYGNSSNENYFITNFKKAGTKRKMGFRPTVRGISKNPCDHPHGGGEGTGSPPRAHKTPTGRLTKSPTNIKKIEKRNRFLFKIFKK
jgi:large subunit ribosomal protein L2